MNRRAVFLLLLTVAGCAAPRSVDTATVVNAGVDIVPDAILASEKITPGTSPAQQDQPDLVQVLSSSPQHHEKILRALRIAGLIPLLREAGPYTLLAPTDEAFSKLPPGLFDRLLIPENQARLVALLKDHLLKGSISSVEMTQTNGLVPTLGKNPVIIKGVDGKVMIDDVNVIHSDTAASNGIIHWTDGVILSM